MNTTWYEKGRQAERRVILRELVEERFGPLSAAVQQRLEQSPVEDLARLTKAVLRAQSLRELGLED